MSVPLGVIPYPQIDPVILRFGPVAIRWYGVSYLTGFLLGYFVLVRLARQGVLRLPAELISDLVGWLALGVVVGGRTGWWIFYHHNLPADEPWWEPVAIWRGGMSFHGGLIGVMLVLYLWTRSTKAAFLNLADCLALVTPIGLCLGRIANFINEELVGRPTTVAWAVKFPGYLQPRHPSQIYEAILEGPILMAVLWLLKSWKNRRDGQIAAAFVFFYAVFRFMVEFTREPDPQLGYIAFGWLTMGQLLSAAIGIGAIIWWIVLNQMPVLPPQGAFPVQPIKQSSQK